MADENQTRNNATSLVGHIIRKGTALLVLALVVAGAYFYLHYTASGPKAGTGQHRGSGKPPTVAVVKIEPQTISLRPQYLGQTAASRTVEVRTRIAGFLQKRQFIEGTKVRKGQLLFTIDPAQFNADLEAAKAQLASHKAQLTQASEQLRRYQKLVHEGAATASELENWQAQVDVAKADMQHDKAAIDQAKLNLSYTQIKSPMDGVIGKTHQNQGAYVSPTGNSLLAIVRKVDPIYVNYSVSEAELLRWQTMIRSRRIKLPADGKLHVRLILADGSTYPDPQDKEAKLGKVDYIGVTVDPSTGTADIRAVVPNPLGELRPGQYVNVTLLGARQSDTVLVPKVAVLETPSGASVYTVDKDNKVEPNVVQLGDWYKKQWVIKSGLKPGQRVLVDHLMTVRPGMTVVPQTESYAAATQPAGKKQAPGSSTQPTADASKPDQGKTHS